MREIVKNAMLAFTRTRFLNATRVYCFSTRVYCFSFDNALIGHRIGTRSISTASNEKEEGDTATTAPTPITRKKPLFTEAASLSELTRKDTNTYITISEEDLKRSIGEGLPAGLTKEYEETKGSSLLVRASFLELRDELKACVEKAKNPNGQVRNPRKQFILDGPVSSGKSITLAMLVHWARTEGWFVFYVPNGKEWTHGGFYYKNPVSPTWDTPRQAITVLERLLKSHETILKLLLCQVFEPITLGEGPGIGMMKDAEVVAMPEGSTLFDLVQTGLTCSHAAVGVVVRLREELALVKEVPVLFVIDQFNSWFTFSQYKEYTGRFSHRDIHARDLTMVASSSAAERNWSTYSFIHSVKRNRLGSKKGEDLVFVHTNLRLLSRKNDHYKEGATKLWDVAPECADLDATLHDLVTVGDGDDVSVARGVSSISGTMLGSNDLSAVGDDNENVDFLANPYDSESDSD